MKVYAVIYSNYEPAEVDSLWTTRKRAEERAAAANEESAAQVKGADQWHVVEWNIRE